MVGRATTLVNFVSRNGWRQGVELGVWRGETLFHLLVCCPYLHMVGVDLWQAQPPAVKNKETGDAPYTDEVALLLAETLVREQAKKFGDRVQIVQMDTAEAASLFRDGSQDFVFIDADHQTNKVLADYNAWLPKVRPGGAIFGHDADWPSVRRALLVIKPMVVGLEGNLWFKPIEEEPYANLSR
jgi:hypothetical protein